MNKPNVSIKIISNHKVVKRFASRKMRRINKFIEAKNYQDCLFNVCVTYAKGITNKGVYKTSKETIEAIKDFLKSAD